VDPLAHGLVGTSQDLLTPFNLVRLGSLSAHVPLS
jgi:hypothetical protein